MEDALELRVGFEIRKSEQSGNIYRVEEIQRDKWMGWAKLKCVWFFEVDDLGDKIECRAEDQEIWVAFYHLRWYVRV
jgi:hypothetical protein